MSLFASEEIESFDDMVYREYCAHVDMLVLARRLNLPPHRIYHELNRILNERAPKRDWSTLRRRKLQTRR